jgi:hypothetical protein
MVLLVKEHLMMIILGCVFLEVLSGTFQVILHDLVTEDNDGLMERLLLIQLTIILLIF